MLLFADENKSRKGNPGDDTNLLGCALMNARRVIGECTGRKKNGGWWGVSSKPTNICITGLLQAAITLHVLRYKTAGIGGLGDL